MANQLAFGFAACLIAWQSSATTQRLPELARAQGGSVNQEVGIDVPVSTAEQVMSRADLVLHGRVVDVAVHLNRAQTHVVTEYTLEPIRVVKQTKPDPIAKPGTSARFVVQRLGGSVSTPEGFLLSTSVNIFPESEAFHVGEEVLVFLTVDERIYEFTGGGYGAYRVRDGVATLMSTEAASRRGDRPVLLSVLLSDLLRQ